MTSQGRLLVVGAVGVAMGWAGRLADKLQVTVLASGPDGDGADGDEGIRVVAGRARSVAGHLGAFTAEWDEGTSPAVHHETFDLVLDLGDPPLIRRAAPPEGYRAPGRDPLDQALAVIELLPLVGEFEKPRYVALRENLCAHSRARQAGCHNCLDVCATAAIVARGDAVAVDPYLCQGCGTCATVCPSGALRYQYPRVADLGDRLRTMLAAYRDAGGEAPCLLFHGATAGRALVRRAGRDTAGLPARVIPVETWSPDAVGLDLMLAAVALGASQVAILATGSHDPAPLEAQARLAQEILSGLGYGGEHVRVVVADGAVDLAAALACWPPAATVGEPADFALRDDKRATLELAIGHLHAQAPTPVAEIPLPAGAPFGSVAASAACTLCMGCVGVCPSNALVAGSDRPQLSFIEHQCLQCGLCTASCPEGALTLTPRLLLEGARRERVLREAEIFRCTRCGKPLGARPLIEAMATKLAAHSMFATESAKARLTMCGDCRVIDLMEHEERLTAAEMTE